MTSGSEQRATLGQPAEASSRAWTVDPRLRVLFLVIVAVGLFFLGTPLAVGIACGALAVMWLAVKLPPRRLVRQVVRLWAFALLVLVAYSLFSSPTGVDRWVDVSILGRSIRVNTSGLEVGALLLLRVLAVILASQIARAGDARAIGAGLKKLHVPRTVSLAIDTVLALFGESDSRRGRGDGSGKRGLASTVPREGMFATVRRLARGDVGPLLARVERDIDRAEAHVVASAPEKTDAHVIRDIAVIAGIALTMLGLKAIKVLPHVPLAPGHKMVLTTPLFVLAGMLTKTRFGATLTGATMGTVAFLLGDGGKFGVFEILNHTIPGIITDLALPILLAGGRTPGPLMWSIFGGLIAIGRFAMIVVLTFLMQAPAAAYAILLPGFVAHMVFGVGSGYVTYRIVIAMRATRAVTVQPVPVIAAPVEDAP